MKGLRPGDEILNTDGIWIFVRMHRPRRNGYQTKLYDFWHKETNIYRTYTHREYSHWLAGTNGRAWKMLWGFFFSLRSASASLAMLAMWTSAMKLSDDGYPLWMLPTIVYSNGKPTPPDLYWYANLDTRQTEKLCLSEAVTRKRNGERLEMMNVTQNKWHLLLDLYKVRDYD